MDHSDHEAVANATASTTLPPRTFVVQQWATLAAIAAATLIVCLSCVLLPCACLRLSAKHTDAADCQAAPDEVARRREQRRSRLAFVTGCLSSAGVGVILATCFMGLIPAAVSAYLQMCATSKACRAAVDLAPPAGCLGCCLLLWLVRTLIELVRERQRGSEETKPLVAPTTTADGTPPGAACCADAATPEALQDPTTACLVTSALMLKAVVEGLALPGMLRVASPWFVGLGKCAHEACCSLVVGLAWCEVGGAAGGAVGSLGVAALVAYAAAASGSILLGGLAATTVSSPAGAAVQFGLLILAAGAGLQAAFVHILPRLPRGPATPGLALAGALLMALVGAMHQHSPSGGGGHSGH